ICTASSSYRGPKGHNVVPCHMTAYPPVVETPVIFISEWLLDLGRPLSDLSLLSLSSLSLSSLSSPLSLSVYLPLSPLSLSLSLSLCLSLPLSAMCRICEWAFENEPAFLNHMNPLTCTSRVCSYRSSFYSDVLSHFASFHRESRFLLCLFCLKVNRNPVSYQQHLLRHQMNQAFHCNRCRLQFVFLKDKMQHKLENHRSFRRPAQLEGLPPGSKVTIRTYGKVRTLPSASPGVRLQSPSSLIQDPNTVSSSLSEYLMQYVSLCPVSRRTSCPASERLLCLECGTDISDFSAHYPTHVSCLLCPYASCCSRAYATVFELQCSDCDFRPQNADQMAEHLLKNPDHYSATCRPRKADDGKEDFIRDVKRPTPGAVAATASGGTAATVSGSAGATVSDSTAATVSGAVADAVSGGPAAAAVACREREDSLSARQLRVALIALCDGLQHASRLFSTDTNTIRRWLQFRHQNTHNSCCSQDSSHGDGSDRMLAWVLSMREQQLPITESNLFHKASALKKKGAFGDAFRISYDWAVGFLLRHRLGVRSVGRAATLARTLPLSLHAKIQSFREFTQKIARTHELPESAVAAMDELCIFVDLRLVQDKSRRRDALELTGSVPLVTVYLAALADGSMLPALVLASRQLAKRAPLPEFIVLEGGAESLLAEEALDLWTNRVWLHHVNAASRRQKSLLVLDRHREHMGDPFLTAVSAAGTLPAVIPAGCAFRLQPLEICVKPVLQRFLLARWAAFSAGSPAELEETSPPQLQANVARLLVDWTVEALMQLEKLPQVWKTSFRLTGVLSRREGEEEETSQQAEEIQIDLIKTLTETLLGADASNAEAPELLELEDEEETEEEGGEEEEEEEMEEEVKETTEEARSDTMKGGEETEEVGELMWNISKKVCMSVDQSFQKEFFCDCFGLKSLIMRHVFLKVRWNMRDIYAILCDEIAGTCKNCGKRLLLCEVSATFFNFLLRYM
uniref:HTH CENPB-type domain-containing protein n=1 Tax=Sander lucioperca TaxID=283035 RepID=A0A8D0CX77_SANLU